VKQRSAFARIAVLLLPLAVLPTASQPDAATIIQHSVEANAVDWKANPEYDWTERDLEPGGDSKTSQEYMILGSPYGRLVAVNGKHLSPEKQREEQQKLDAEISKRRNESPDQRRQRIAEFEKERKRDNVMMEQLTHAFNFKLVGEQKLDSYDVYVLAATPKPGYQPPNMQSQALKGMEGKLWIDKASYQWVKVEAEVVHPVSIDGFLAKVEPGTRFELDKAPVDKGVWLPKHFSMKARAKVLFFFSHRSADDETYWGYHKAQDYSVKNAAE
jgi:hypothetical protein